MFEYNQSKEQIIIKRRIPYVVTGIVLIAVATISFCLLIEFLPPEKGYTFTDMVEVIIVCVFLFATLVAGMGSFVINSAKVIIDDTGVMQKFWFRKVTYNWTDINEWGLSYCGETRFQGGTYYLYFSKAASKRKAIKVFVFSREHDGVVNTVIPFCQKRIAVVPLIERDLNG